MKNQIFTGIGCFAKPERLSRLFNKLVQDYALGPFEGDQLLNQNTPAGCEGVDLLKALIAGPPRGRQSGGCETIKFREHQKITGFYLSLFDQKLNLAIFARGNSSKQEIYTAKLDEIERLSK